MNFLLQCWLILCELAPWMLLGMLLSGLLEVLLPKNFIQRKLTGTKGIFAAVGLGVPLPLCSCGVVPAGIGLKNQGASDGAAVGFLISTPQTGLDSILVAASFFGWPFAIFKMLAAAITGVVGGLLTDRVSLAGRISATSTDLETVPPKKYSLASALPVLQPQPVPSIAERELSWIEKITKAWTHGIMIVRSIWGWLVIGILVSSAIQTLVPATWFEMAGQWNLLTSMLLVLLISIPLYVCATASVPIAAAIVHSGFPPAAALVFLMAGPATNVTTIGAIYSRFGWRTSIVYLTTIIGGSMFFAWLFERLLTASVVTASLHQHTHLTWWSIGSAVVLLALIGYFIGERFFFKSPSTH